MTNQIKQFLQEANPKKLVKGNLITDGKFMLICSKGHLALFEGKLGDDILIEDSTDPELIAAFESLFSDNIQDKVKAAVREIEDYIGEFNEPNYDSGLNKAVSIIKNHLLKGSE
jgi:hypothetical protein